MIVGLYALAVVLAFSSTSSAQFAPYEPIVEYQCLEEGECPVSVVVDKVGNAWVSLQPICEVRQYTPDWQEVTWITLVPDCRGDTGASGLAVDATGRLYAAVKGSDAAVRGVYEVFPSGATLRIPGTEEILFPNSIAFDHHNGTMYVSDMYGGAVWRVPRGGSAERWAASPALSGSMGGANGIAVDRGEVVVSVTYPASVVRIPIAPDGSAGAPRVVASSADLAAFALYALDDIALDVFGNVMASAVVVGGVGRVAADGSAVQRLAILPAPAVSLAFGTGKGARQSLFVALNNGIGFGGAFSGIVKIDASVPGRPLP